MDNCVFTIATGAKYLKFAYALARSYRLHNNLEIPFFIVSDTDFKLPDDLKWVKKKIISIVGKGLEYRFNFNTVSPAERSLFIDADSMIYNNVEPIFILPNSSMTVIGLTITDGKWADLDAQEVIKEFNIPYVIRYCGAFYYIVKNAVTKTICETATSLLKSGYSFQQHTYSVNDEPILSISMAKQGVKPIIDNGRLWTDIAQLESHKNLNVLKGITQFHNSANKKNYKFWLPEGYYSPIIVHFGGGNFNKNPWVFDALRLKLYYKYSLNLKIADAIVISIFKPVYFFGKLLNNLFK